MHEAALLAWLVTRGESLAVAPLAADPERGWIVTADGGPTLRSTRGADGRPGDQDPAIWARLLPIHGEMQRGVVGAVQELLALAVPDERPERYPAILDQLLADDAIWTRVDDADRGSAEETRRRLDAAKPAIVDLAARLAASTVAASLDHGDLHGNNVLVGPGDEMRVFDWGDAVVAHPFATLTTTLGSIGHHAGLDPYGHDLDGVRDAYLEGWLDVASLADLRTAATLAMDLGHLGKAAAWERALRGLEPNEMAGFHGATAAWLRDAGARLERW
jgi:hypothetical protein